MHDTIRMADAIHSSTRAERTREDSPASAADTRVGANCDVIITIDVEPDDAWTNHLNPSVRNVHELPRLHEMLRRCGARATLLVTQRVIDDAACRETLKRLVAEGGAEVGAHLHPWETPPFSATQLDTRYATFPHELAAYEFEAKLAHLTASIARHFDTPRSYRAGRWGFAASHVRALEHLGYVADTSVIPRVDWRGTFGIPVSEGGRGGADYRFAPRAIYRQSYEDVCVSGAARLIELPVTVAFTRPVSAWMDRNYGRLPNAAHRVLRKMEWVRPVWATPAEEPQDRLLTLVDRAMAERRGLFNIAFHSSELMLDGSPTSRTVEDVNGMFERLERMLTALREHGCRFVTMGDAAKRWADVQQG